MTVDFRYYLNRQGVPGRQGEQGEPGFSPIITIEEDTLSSFVLAIQTEGNYILTPNLREHKEDLGGTYIRYNRETGVMYAGDADYADTGKYGVVKFASADDIARDDDSTAVTPNNVNSIISDKGLISAEDLRTYLQPGNHITFTINDGVITINGEAGGNYTEGTGIDITNKVISVDFSAVATAAQGAKADSAVQPAALNNYYTKSAVYNKGEVDVLLDEKQDKLTPNNPLSISTYTKSNLYGLSYTSDNTGVYLANNSQQYIGVFRDGRISNSGTTSDANFWVDTGYIDIPYTIGNTVSAGVRAGSLDGFTVYAPHCLFGKQTSEGFIPIIGFAYGSSDGSQVIYYPSDSYTTTIGSSSIVRTYPSVYGSSLGSTSTSSLSINIVDSPYGTLAQIVDTGSSIKITGMFQFREATKYIYYNNITNAEYISRIKEIDTCRILTDIGWGSSSSHPIVVSKIGLYNYPDTITDTTYTTIGILGTNLFDISGVQTHNYLDLHIGSGLAVQNGNLVNTNPTPTDLSNYYTMSETNDLLAGKADTSDIPTVGDGTITFTQGGVTKGTITTNQSGDTTIALDAGGGSSYTEGAGIDITNDEISVKYSTGLSVDSSGNLVNTNPTPYALPIASTSTLGGVKVDGTTVTIDANGVISSSGGGGGTTYTAGTGIDITSNVISITMSLLQQIATMQDLINQYSYRISALENSINGGNSDLSGNVLPSANLASFSLLSGGLHLSNSENLDIVDGSISEQQGMESDSNNTNSEDR